MKKIFILLAIIVAFSFKSYAQKIFSEGIIKYDVYINNNTTPDGIYVITVKGGFIKRELAMNNGYNNITIYNQKTGKTLSLNLKDETKYALEITEQELKEKNKRFENAIITYTENSKKLAGYKCTSANITYNNNDKVTIFYTNDLIPQNETFNTMFPNLKGIPFEYSTDKKMKFVATLIEIKPIDSKVFTIPDNYKIVTKEELMMLK